MSTVSDNGFPNLVNVLRWLQPDGSLAIKIADRISKLTPAISDIPWVEGNRIDGHRLTALQTIPAPSVRNYNQGAKVQKPGVAPYEEKTTNFESRFYVDLREAQATGDVDGYRAKNIMKMAIGYRHKVEESIFYANQITAPDGMHGFTPRYNKVAGKTTSPYLMKRGTHGGSASLSVWLVSWDQDLCYGIYPKHGMPGFQHKDLGTEDVLEPGQTDKYLEVLRSKLSWECGLVIEDHRHIVRLQIDPVAGSGDGFGPTGKGLYLGMLEMLDIIQARENPNLRFYMGRTLRSLLRQQLAANDANFFTQGVMRGDMKVDAFDGVILRTSEALTTETAAAA